MVKEIPLFVGNPKDKSILCPVKYRDYVKNIKKVNHEFPERAILTFGDKVFKYAKRKFKIIRRGKYAHEDYIVFEYNGKEIALVTIKIGAPAAVGIMLEEIIPYGLKKAIFIGSAGGIGHDIKIGDAIIPDRAVRDEGVSYHYLKPSKFSYPDKSLLNDLIDVAKKKNFDFNLGGTWTTDAPYRETYKKQEKYSSEGVVSVEMEAASMFAVAKYRKIKIAGMFSVSDVVRKDWDVGFHTKDYKKTLREVFNIALEAISR